MTLRAVKMRFQENKEAEDNYKTDENVLKELVQDVVRDYQDLTRQYRVCPVKMHTMIPLPLDDLVGLELATEREFLGWLVRDKNVRAQWETYCIPRTEAKSDMVVDFYNAWPINNWYRGHVSERPEKDKKLQSYIEEMKTKQ